jgi:reductive dehalogenase
LLGMAMVLVAESLREQEQRAVRVGVLAVLSVLVITAAISLFPVIRVPVAIAFGLLVLCGLAFCIPGPRNTKALGGAMGYAVGTVTRLDESCSVFVRNRGLPEGSEPYRRFYAAHPELEAPDRLRRQRGLLGQLGSIDNGYQPNTAMVHAAFEIPDYLGPYARSEPYPGASAADLTPEKATLIVKHYARHLGADMVGICEVNPAWAYSKRGEIHYDHWEDWGRDITDLPRYAVVFLLEMERAHVMSAPHTPSVAESAVNYAKGAYIATLLGRWFSHLGYRGVAEHTRHYDLVLPPLAADAGLGEIGRQGYLIAPRFGARVRIFATLTDMPLVPDRPISLGVEAFCRKCMKCADSCPSRSIPFGAKTVCRGVEKWKLDEDSCFAYWARVGTDCSICMAICPFSRPDTPFHRLIRWFVAHSALARIFFPPIDNFIYGKRWKARRVPDWLSYPRRSVSEDYPTFLNDRHY